MLAALWSNDLFFIFLRISVSLYSWTIQKAYLSSTFYSWYFAVGFVIRGGESSWLWKCWPKLPKCLCRLDQRAGSVRPGREADASPHIWVCFFSWILLSIIYLYSLSLLSFLVSIGRPMHLLISAVCIFSWILLAPSGALIAIPTYYWPTSTSTPLFQITPVLNTGLSLSEPLQLYKGYNAI